MVKKIVTWNSSVNFHMRPVGTFSQEMGRFSSSIRLTYGEFRADGKSMMNLMAAGIPARAQLEVECAGFLRAAFPFLRTLACIWQKN